MILGCIKELAQIYINRGLSQDLAHQVAIQLMAKDALAAHTRDELGITEVIMAKPLQAAFSSALSFISGGIIPLLVAMISNHKNLLFSVTTSTILALAILGTLGAFVGGVKPIKPIVRIVTWGIISMSITAFVSALFHVK